MLRFSLFFIACATILSADSGHGIECFHCAYNAADETTSMECANQNTTVISNCENSTACLQLSYENPDTEEYVSFFLDCGTTLCKESNSDGIEQVELNSSFNNFTKKTTCFAAEYGNCNSAICNETKVEHLEAIKANVTERPTESANIDCFRCVHIPQKGEASPSCTEDRTTEHVQCPESMCMKLSQQFNNGSTDYIIYTLDCGQGKCNDSIADGVERSSVTSGPDPILEKLTCCAEEYCNCKTSTCLESIGVTNPPDVSVETTEAMAVGEEPTTQTTTVGELMSPMPADPTSSRQLTTTMGVVSSRSQNPSMSSETTINIVATSPQPATDIGTGAKNTSEMDSTPAPTSTLDTSTSSVATTSGGNSSQASNSSPQTAASEPTSTSTVAEDSTITQVTIRRQAEKTTISSAEIPNFSFLYALLTIAAVVCG